MTQVAPVKAYASAHRLTLGAELLRGQYVIRDYLADGGFAQTYLAEDSLGRLVVIKECFPSEICIHTGEGVQPMHPDQERLYRALVAQFVKEARRLARLEHPNIIKVHQVFEENGTAYMALDHVEGSDLQSVIDDAPDRLTPNEIETILRSSLNALGYVHGQGLLHRDIAPDNLMLDRDGAITLIDFGSARDLVSPSTARPEMLAVKDGYSPPEFYDQSSHQSEASDYYALAATIYHLITRSAPVAANSRIEALQRGRQDPFTPLCRGTWGCERKVLASVDLALSLDPSNRPQSARHWLDMLDGVVDIVRSTPSSLPEPELDPELETRVAELVRAVKIDIPDDQKPAGMARAPKQTALDLPRPVERKQLVDMFGTPIPDVEAWLREQDRMKPRNPEQATETRPSVERAREESTVADSTPEPAPARSIFSRMFGRRRKPAQVAPDADRKDHP